MSQDAAPEGVPTVISGRSSSIAPSQNGANRVRIRASALAALAALENPSELTHATLATAVLVLEHPRRFGVDARRWAMAMSRLCSHTKVAVEAPLSWFCFEGGALGELRLPTVRLGSSRGYTFTAWVRITDAVDVRAGGHAQSSGEAVTAHEPGWTSVEAAAVRAATTEPSKPSKLKSVFKGVFKKDAPAAVEEVATSPTSPVAVVLLRMEPSSEAGLGAGPASGQGSTKASSSGTGMEVLLLPVAGGAAPGALQFHVVMQGNRAGVPPVAALDPSTVVTLVPNQWHCVGLSHSQPYLKRSKAKFYLDGVLAVQQDVQYPSAKELDNVTVSFDIPGECFR